MVDSQSLWTDDILPALKRESSDSRKAPGATDRLSGAGNSRELRADEMTITRIPSVNISGFETQPRSPSGSVPEPTKEQIYANPSKAQEEISGMGSSVDAKQFNRSRARDQR